MDIEEQDILKASSKQPSIKVTGIESYRYEFNSDLAKITAIISVKEMPDVVHKEMIFEEVVSKYSNLSRIEIIEAFKLNQKNRLSQNFKPYGLLDVNFFCQVVDQYVQDKRKATLRYNQLLPPAKEQEPVQTPEDSYNGLIDYYKKNGSFPDWWSYQLVYQHMNDLLMIDYNDPRKKEIYNAVQSEFKVQDELKVLEKADTNLIRSLSLSLPDRVKNEAIKRYVQEVLQKEFEKDRAVEPEKQ